MLAPTAPERASPELGAMLAVSQLAGSGVPLGELLDRIAAEAASVVRARSAGVLLLGADGTIRLAGGWGLSSSYASLLAAAPALYPGHGPAGIAVQRGAPFAVADTELDPLFAPWRAVSRSEGYRAMASVPLPGELRPFGALNVYRPVAEPWPERELALLGFFGEHAASAIRTSQLIDRQTRDLGALTRLVRGLREQTHEYANQLHAIRGLLALDAPAEALRFTEDLAEAHHDAYGSIAAGIEQPLLAGLLLAETATAQRRGIALEIDESSGVRALPPRLTETEAVTIVGNLLENAFDAVAPLAPERRRVRLTLAQLPAGLTVRVRDHGPGIPAAERARVLERGTSGKTGHAGVGLALVRDAVAAAGGRLRIEPEKPGVAFEAWVPGG